MNEDQRARMLDEAVEANDAEIARLGAELLAASGADATDKARDSIAHILTDYCKEHGWEEAQKDITMSEVEGAIERKLAAMSAAVDQMQAGTSDLQKLAELISRASFEKEGMNVEQIVAEMDRRGELSEAEVAEIEGIVERMPYLNVPLGRGESG